MPKRRMTPARQRQVEQWRLAGTKARKDGVPMGKKVTLYHRSPFAENRKLIQANGFHKQDYEKWIWFSNRREGEGRAYGDYVTTVKVNRKAVRATNRVGANELFVGVDPAYLKQLHRRVKNNAERKAKGWKPIRRRPIKVKAGIEMSIDTRRYHAQKSNGRSGRRVR